MAPKTDVPETQLEGLQALLPSIASIMAAPDADIPFLDKLSKVVLLKIHEPKGQTPPVELRAKGAQVELPGVRRVAWERPADRKVRRQVWDCPAALRAEELPMVR